MYTSFMQPMSCLEAQAMLEVLKANLVDFKQELAKLEQTRDENALFSLKLLKQSLETGTKNLYEGLGYVLLKNIPDWKALPDAETLEKNFRIDSIRVPRYYSGRSSDDFEIQNSAEAGPWAKVFKIRDALKQKRQTDPNHPNHLTTDEVLEVIDKAGCRPATLQELLVYARDHWDLKREPYFFALNSVFLTNERFRHVPGLSLLGDQLTMTETGIDHTTTWYDFVGFLVLRKTSSK